MNVFCEKVQKDFPECVYRVETIDGTALTEVPGGGYQVRLPMPPADYSYGLLIKYLDTPVDSHLSVAP